MEINNKENTWNLANFLTFLRVILTFLIIFLVFANFGIVYIIVVFIIGMLTDAADGWVARRTKTTTEFGRQFDIIADRVLMMGAALAIIIKFSMEGFLSQYFLLQIFLIMSREMIALPLAILGIVSQRVIPKVRLAGKMTTFMQAITFPLIMLNMFYNNFNFSIYFTVVTSAVGAIAGFYYINDIKHLTPQHEQ